MDKATSVLGAFDAQKLPSQAQTNAWIDWLVHQIDEISAHAPDSPHLSGYGEKLATDVKRLLLSYKQLGDHKNGDDQLQDAIWNLTQSQANMRTERASVAKDEVITDAQKLSSALQNILFIFWGHFTSFDNGSELISLIRNVLGDTAEVVEQKAGSAKSQLRDTEEQVQRSEHDEAQDARQRFEAGMDTAKATGSQAIGAGQSVKHGFDEMGEKSTRRLGDVLNNVLERAQNDTAYRDSVTTIFEVTSKWVDKSVDAADKTSIDDVVDDPSGRIPAAWSSLKTLLGRLASGNKSTHELMQALRAAAEDVRSDPELHEFFDDIHDFVRRTLHEPTYARSEEHSQKRAQLHERWQSLQSGETHRKWHDDLDTLRSLAKDYKGQIEQERDVQSLRDAYTILNKDAGEAVATLNEAAMGATNWIWQDTMNVIVPRLLENIKSLPVPRTEFKDADVEFVIEDLNITSLRVLPGHAHFRNTTDMDVSKESTGKDATTQVRSQTQIRLRGVQFTAKDVSFWYNDPSMKPVSEVSGLLGITVPEQGVDVDIILRLDPQRDQKARDNNQHAFFNVDRVKVTLNNPQFAIEKTNHPILFTTFKPMFRSRLEHSIETSLEQQIATAIHALDGLAYDVHRRAGVFRDTGMAPSASYISAVWSEIGHLKDLPGPFSGLQATSVGVVRDDPRTDIKFAIGAQPQIIPGEKHGPEVPGSNAHEQRQEAAQLAEQVKSRADDAKERGVQAGEGVQHGVTTFAEEVRVKKEGEKLVDGWKSTAFDAPW